jgi:hypothetical protein
VVATKSPWPYTPFSGTREMIVSVFHCVCTRVAVGKKIQKNHIYTIFLQYITPQCPTPPPQLAVGGAGAGRGGGARGVARVVWGIGRVGY